MRTTFVNCLVERAKLDEKIWVVSPDMGYSVFEAFIDLFPDRFINVGIAEQNAVDIAAGLALRGKIPYVYSIIPFVTMRCFEQIRVNLAYMNTNVRLVGVGAGLTYGAAGATHHSLEDIAIMRALPNMSVCCPGDPRESKILIEYSFEHNGPMYFRLGKKGEPVINQQKVTFGKGSIVIDGTDLAIITTSNMLEQGYKWVGQLKNSKISVKLISIHTIKPLDRQLIIDIIDSNLPIVTLEEHNIIGGLGSAIAEIISEYGKAVKFKRIAINDQYTHHVGSQEILKTILGLNDISSIIEFLNCKY